MKKYILIPGDILAIALVTIIGFATHRETGLSVLPRAAAVFFPLLISWFLLAPAVGLFKTTIATDLKQLWRPVLAMVFAGSLAVILRGLILNAPVIPIFAVVLSATSAFGMLFWRWLYWLLGRKVGAGGQEQSL